uniref:Uncharacterized protein n=1 Tax=Anguilla anguilla TaxID=7936 RepID=A0A0E9TWC6_ANGAN
MHTESSFKTLLRKLERNAATSVKTTEETLCNDQERFSAF